MAAKYVPFFESFWLGTRGMDGERRLRIYDAVLSFGFTGEVPDLNDDEALAVAFELMRPNIEAVIRKCEQNRRAGEASGRARRDKKQ